MGQGFTCGYDLYNHRYNLYTLGWDVFMCKNILYTRYVCLLFPWVQCQSLKPVLSQCSQTRFVTVMILLLCTLPHMYSIPMGAINFYLQERFLHLQIPLLFPSVYVFYSHGCNVRAWNLFWASVAKPDSWELIILLPCTLTHTS